MVVIAVAIHDIWALSVSSTVLVVPRVVSQVSVVGYVASRATDIAIAKIERFIGVQVVQTLQGLLGIHTAARV